MGRENLIARRTACAAALVAAGGLAAGAVGCAASGEGAVATAGSSDDTAAATGAGLSTGSPSEQTRSQAATMWLYNPAGITAAGIAVDTLLRQTMDADGIVRPPLAGTFTARVEMLYSDDPYAEVTELFYQRGWTDGLPIVPPSEERVAAMARAAGLPREHVVATLGPQGGQATVEKIAANAVMAGCRPAWMPLLMAAVEAVGDPEYDLVGVGTTTNPNASMIIVNGPAAAQAGVNCGSNVLGRGWAANATLGRALHLVEQNVGGSWPAVSDLTCIGMPGDFSMAMAENEAESPWEPLHVELGFSPEETVVTVASVEGMQRIVDIGVDAIGFLKRVVAYISGREEAGCDLLLLLTPTTANKLAAEGWDKEDIRAYINENTRVHPSRLDDGFVHVRHTVEGFPFETAEPDEDGLVLVPFVRNLVILVAGGPGEKDCLMPLWAPPLSRSAVLPANWDDLVEGVGEADRRAVR